MPNNFVTTIGNRIKKNKPELSDEDSESFLKMKLRFGIDENTISEYQKAFLILLSEKLDGLNPEINSEIDKSFEQNKEWNGIVEEGMVLPTDNSERWEQIFQFTMSGQQIGPLFHICFKGWEIERTFTYVKTAEIE